jgi:hypothetical protein
MGEVKGGVEHLVVSTGDTFDIDGSAKHNIQRTKKDDVIAGAG